MEHRTLLAIIGLALVCAASPNAQADEPLCLEHLVIRAAEPVVLKPRFQEWRRFESGRSHGPPNFDGEDAQIQALWLAGQAR